MSKVARERILENIKKHRRGEDARVLDLSNCGMTELPGEIKDCVWLEDLDVRENEQFSDLSPLSNLTNLQGLNCGSTSVSDLSPLSNLTTLQVLTCSYTPVSDLSPLSNLTTLQSLNCSSTLVSDLSPLSNLTTLKWLYCNSTAVSDLSPLSNLIALQTLYCDSTRISDLSPLSNLIALQSLACGSSSVSDLSPLSNLTALQSLDCSSTSVSDLSPLSNLIALLSLSCYSTPVLDLLPLSNLTALHRLICRYTSVSDLSPLSNLTALQSLDCSSTSVSDLSPLSNLTTLQSLYCNSTSVSDLSPLSNLTTLQSLNCSSTLVSDLSPLSNLTALQGLVCYSSSVSDLSPLSNLTALQSLNCGSTHISDLSPLSNLTALQSLSCGSTPVSDLSPLSNLTALQSLYCNSTSVSDLSPLSNLTTLQSLICGSTAVSDLSPLSNLTALKRLSCYSTPVSDLSPIIRIIEKGIPVKWLGWDRRNGISVKDCPLVYPPVEFAQESPQAVVDYFEELGPDGKKLNEVKVLFLGEASAGKTSIVKKLMGEAFDNKESQTHGIRIRKMPFDMADGDAVIAHLWDFGGQEVMHATHQFFLSQRSVYVLLLNSRNDDQAEKWLKHAAGFGGRSPVLVVLNKIDENPSFQVDNKRLLEKYPQIRGFYRVSAADGQGMAEFREALRLEIERADTRRTPFPEHWLEVKAHFSNMTADYIESAEYKQVCLEKGVTKEFSQDVLLKFLHDLGVVINFRNLKNFDTQILNPLWLTNGVYRIINSKIVGEDTKGLLRECDFDRVINDPRFLKEGNTSDRVYHYPKGKLNYIVRVMQEFELCFQLDTSTYVVPQLLPVQEPDFQSEGAMLHFVLHFPDFLPDSVFPRLMVKLHTFISGGNIVENAWRTGMILHKPNIFKALARVRWDKEDQKILVDVCGEERRRFLSFIRETVKEIVGDFTNLKYNELVPIPGCAETEEYDYLVEAEKAKETEVFVKALKKRVLISDLLDGVEEAMMRDETEQMPVRAFVSYAHKDLDYLKELRTALAPLIRLQKLQIWDDRDIEAGGDWEKVIFQQLEESDIVLCLVSADFVASDFCYKREFGAALEAHRRGEKTIVPVMLRKTDWQDLPLAQIQGVPGEWIASANNKDEAWTKVSELLRPALAKAKARKKELSDSRRLAH